MENKEIKLEDTLEKLIDAARRLERKLDKINKELEIDIALSQEIKANLKNAKKK